MIVFQYIAFALSMALQLVSLGLLIRAIRRYRLLHPAVSAKRRRKLIASIPPGDVYRCCRHREEFS